MKPTVTCAIAIALCLGVAAPAAHAQDYGSELPERLITVNPLGVLQFGPIVGMEFRALPASYVGVHVRWATAGLAYYAIASEGFEYTVNADNFAFGLNFRSLMGDNQSPHRWYAAPVLEYGFGTWSGGNLQGNTSYVSILGNFGHRWNFGSSVLNVGAYAGVVQEFIEEETLAIGMLELSFGWPF